MRLITQHDLRDLAFGAAVLGTGGGGDPYIGRLMAESAIREFGPVTALAPEELPDTATVLPIGMMGAPTVMVEKLPGGHEALSAVSAQERQLGLVADAVMSPEVGGLNSTIALAVAAARGLPVVDADMVGRAFPELQMCTPSLVGVAATPLAMADDKGNQTSVTAVTHRWAERLARAVTVEMGCWAMVSLYPMTGVEVKRGCIPGTLSLVQSIGARHREARARHLDPVAAVCEATGGCPIWCGKVVDVARHTVGGFARGHLRVAGLESDSRNTLTIRFQNEFLVAETETRVLATTPDLITMIDSETGEPITTETARYGARVTVVAIPGDPRWRSKAGLAVVGPASFGYQLPFVPVEERLGWNATGKGNGQ